MFIYIVLIGIVTMNSLEQLKREEQYSTRSVNLLTKEQIDACLEYIDDSDGHEVFLHIMSNLEYIKVKYETREIPPFSDDFPYSVNKYKVMVKSKNGKGFISGFYTSLNNTENHIAPSLYDILTVIASEGTMESGSLEDFCDEFGYDINEPKTKKTYKNLLKYQEKVLSVFDEDDLICFPH